VSDAYRSMPYRDDAERSLTADEALKRARAGSALFTNGVLALIEKAADRGQLSMTVQIPEGFMAGTCAILVNMGYVVKTHSAGVDIDWSGK
jgi:hypothetical protein